MEIPPERPAGWRAWYADRVYDSKTSNAHDLPEMGLLHAISYIARGNKISRRIIHTGQVDPDAIDKWYTFYPDLSVGEYEGPAMPLMLRKDVVFIRGGWASDTIYNNITERAWNYKWQP